MHIDTSFDVRTDSGGKDPDKCSPTLRRYHKELWSKPLPIGSMFSLDDQSPRTYLRHTSDSEDFQLASDTVVPTFRAWKSMQEVIRDTPTGVLDAFQRANHTIGGFMIFPGNRVGRGMTINGARGFSKLICDRFDLTLECIRLHYNGEDNPLARTLHAYSRFFDLFRDFAGYAEFFLLQDLVDNNGGVRFLMPFDGFYPRPVPRTVDDYLEYARRSMEWIEARNRRIESWSANPGN